MKLKVVTTFPEKPPLLPEPVLLFKLEQQAEGLAMVVQLEGDSLRTRHILTISEKGIRRTRWAGGLGLPVDEVGRVVDYIEKE